MANTRELSQLASLIVVNDATRSVQIQDLIVTTSANISGASTFAGITTHTASLFGTQASFTGVVTASSFSGNAISATYATTAGIATYATSSGIATYATTAGIATYATNAGISTSVIGGIGSVTQLQVTGISTLGVTSTTNLTTQQLNVSGLSTFAGITTHTASLFGTQASFTGVVTASSYRGDGSLLTGISAGFSISTNTTNQAQYIPYATSFGSTTGLGATTLLVYNPLTGNLGIGTTNPNAIVTLANTAVLAAGIVTAYKLYGDGSNITSVSSIARVTVSASAPSSPSNGDMWYHTTLGRTFVYYNDGDSAQWVDSAPFNVDQSSGGGTSVSVGATAPSGPSSGDLWYNSSYGRLFVYYRDGDSDQWVDAAPFNFGNVTTPTKTETLFTATAGQTVFSVTYAVGYLDVYRNGVRLRSGSDYVGTSGTCFILTNAAIVNDELASIEYATGVGPTGPMGPTGASGALSGIAATTSSNTFYPLVVTGIGTTTPYISTTSNYFSFIPSSGTLKINQLNVVGVATATSFSSSSDLNLKENIKVIDNPLAKVLQLNGVSFDWKDTQQSSVGVIAQDVEKVLPSIVRDNSTGYKSLDYNGLIGLLIEAVKEQQRQIEELKKLINN